MPITDQDAIDFGFRVVSSAICERGIRSCPLARPWRPERQNRHRLLRILGAQAYGPEQLGRRHSRSRARHRQPIVGDRQGQGEHV